MGGPYAPTNAGIGGTPTVSVDVPICVVFMVLFIAGAVSHMTILQVNLRRKHFFRISGMAFGYCMARTMTCVMRIVWATHQRDIQVAIAAGIFSNAGVFIAFLINLIFAQRLFTAAYPHIATSKPFALGFKALYAIIILTLAAVITSVVQSFYTRDAYILHVDRVIQLVAITLIFVIAALPIPLTLAAVIAARRRGSPPKNFGSGSWNGKVAILTTTTLLALTVAGFRLGTTWMPPRPASNPYWFDARWCYYFFNFVFDIAIIYTFLLTRVDRRFHVIGKNDVVSDSDSGGEEQFEEAKAEKNRDHSLDGSMTV